MSDPFAAAALYDSLMGPIYFTPAAQALVDRIAASVPDPTTVLEVAAGSGQVTAELRHRFPGAAITATDLSESMVGYGSGRRPPGVTWLVADAQNLPLGDATTDLVVAAFGMMFFPDRGQALRESARVLRPGGLHVQTSWASLVAGDVDLAAVLALEPVCPEAARVLRDVIHGYDDRDLIRAELTDAGFDHVGGEMVEVPIQTSGIAVGRALALGSALQAPIRAAGLDPEAVASLIADQIGPGSVSTTLRFLVAMATAAS